MRSRTRALKNTCAQERVRSIKRALKEVYNFLTVHSIIVDFEFSRQKFYIFSFQSMNQKYHGYCEKLDLESVTFQSDAEVDGFIQLIKVGNLSLENNLFDLNAWRNEQNQFAFRGGFQSINTTFTKLKIIEDSEEFDCIGKDAL